MTRCVIPLLDKESAAASYTVRLYFSAADGDQPDQRVFDVKLQGKLVAEKLDVVARASATNRAYVLEEHEIPVTRELVIELVPGIDQPAVKALPILCGIEMLQSGHDEILDSLTRIE